jgi:hypothetical protein
MYLACTIIALTASRMRSNPATAGTAPFWLRIAIVCGVFALLRFFDAHMAVSATLRDFSHAAGLTNWARPGPYVMLVAIGALGLAVAGLLFFRFRTLHASILGAAVAIILLVLLALAHSLSLYWTGVYLEAKIGPLTVSRIIEAGLLLILAACGAWFIADGRIHDRSGRRIPL